MGFGVKHRKKGFHVKKMLELWAFICNSLEVGPILACNIHTKETDLPTGQLLLEVQGVGKDFSPVHI